MSAAAPVSLAAPSAWSRATRSGGLVIGVVLVSALIAIAALAPWVAPYDPDAQDVLNRLGDPSPSHWFGTDEFGRDLLSGWVDRVITACTDVLLSFPQLIMGLILVAVLGPSLQNLILAIAVTAVPAFVRVARGSTLAMKERDFVDACRALGYGDLRIMFLHVLPNILDEVVVMASLWLATAIRTESTLAFIGLGVPPPTATWGGIVREGFDNLLDAPWMSVFPSLAILAVMIALNLIGDGLRDATDPRAPQ